MYRGLIDEKKMWVRVVVGILAIYMGYREIVQEQWVYVPIAVLLLLACFFVKEQYVSEEGVEIDYKLLGLKTRNLWKWDEITAAQIDKIPKNTNVRFSFAKDVTIRSFVFSKEDAEGILKLMEKEKPEIPVNNNAF